jgi:16S rRNA (guanine1207-N2)-methyltransferase
MHNDRSERAALATLFLPFSLGVLPWPRRIAFLRARPEPSLPQDCELVCEQTFKPDADALQQAGYDVVQQIPANERFDLVMVLPPRQRDESRSLLARAMRLVGPAGRVVAAAANTSGARSIESDLEKLAGQVESQSKNKCRVCWTGPLDPASVDARLLDEWSGYDAPRPILDGQFVSRPGVFAWDRIDPASQLLAEELPTTLQGRAADLGAGFGYLSFELLRRCPGVTALDVYEAEARALALCRENLSAQGKRVAIDYRWHDVTTGLPNIYDTIVTNPPFHTGSGAEDPGLGRRFIAVAAQSLVPGGRLWLVANRHLPYESILNASFGNVRSVTQRYGFKVIEAVRSGRGSPR